MLYSVQVTAEKIGCPRRSDTKTGQIGFLVYYIIIARPAIIRYSSTRRLKSNQLELLSWN
jgi:hypothetical protein